MVHGSQEGEDELPHDLFPRWRRQDGSLANNDQEKSPHSTISHLGPHVCAHALHFQAIQS